MNDTYVVPYQGGTIECTTGLDAIAVKLADRVLSGRAAAKPVDLLRAANALDQYGYGDDARRLRTEALAEMLARTSIDRT